MPKSPEKKPTSARSAAKLAEAAKIADNLVKKWESRVPPKKTHDRKFF